MLQAQSEKSRRAMRRAARLECQAVSLDPFNLIAEQVLDVSPLGLLVACDDEAKPGDEVIVSFKAPGEGAPWLDAEAEVARVVEGYRTHDPGYCAGLRFTYFERPARNELLARLAGLPPPVPARAVRPLPRILPAQPAVVVHRTVEVSGVVLPLTRRIFRVPAYPTGVWN